LAASFLARFIVERSDPVVAKGSELAHPAVFRFRRDDRAAVLDDRQFVDENLDIDSAMDTATKARAVCGL
jgi:hypothetical protein